MRPAVIIVAEPGQRWLAAVRTAFRRSPAQHDLSQWVRVTHLREVVSRLAEVEGDALVVCEVSPPVAAQAIELIDRWRVAHGQLCCIGALSGFGSDCAAQELALAVREAGAVHVLYSPLEAEAIPQIWTNHFRTCKQSSSSPSPERRPVNDAWAGPPWHLHEVIPLPACWRHPPADKTHKHHPATDPSPDHP